MILSELKEHLKGLSEIHFILPDGNKVEPHFHITEVAKTNKKFIDCGGTLRNESCISLQLWSADDYNHRLHPDKFLDILNLSEAKLKLQNNEIEVEYQGKTIETYHLDFEENQFILKSKFTDCLAKDKCGIPPKKKINLSEINKKNTCEPGSGCC